MPPIPSRITLDDIPKPGGAADLWLDLGHAAATVLAMLLALSAHAWG